MIALSWDFTDWRTIVGGTMIVIGGGGLLLLALQRNVLKSAAQRSESDALLDGAVLASSDPGVTLAIEVESRKAKPRCSTQSMETIRRMLVDSDFHNELDHSRDRDVATEHYRPGKPEAFRQQLQRFAALGEEEVEKVRTRALDTLVRLYAANLTDAQVADLTKGPLPVYSDTPSDPDDYLAPHPRVRFREHKVAHFGDALVRIREEVILRYAGAAVGHAEERLRQELGLPSRFAD